MLIKLDPPLKLSDQEGINNNYSCKSYNRSTLFHSCSHPKNYCWKIRQRTKLSQFENTIKKV